MNNQRKELKKQAIEFLIEKGLLIPFDENLELYHGRARKIEDKSEWKVDSNYNSSYVNNVYGIPMLSTADRKTASDFAIRNKEDSGKDNYISEIHKIVSSDKNALIFNKSFDFSNLNEEERKMITTALMRVSNYEISQLSPSKFEDRDSYVKVYEILKRICVSNNYQYISEENVNDVIRYLNNENKRQLVRQIAGAMNAKLLFIYKPEFLMKKFGFEKELSKRTWFEIEGNGMTKRYPLNQEYVSSLLINNNIIGIRSIVDSARLSKKIIGYYFFDLYKINTEKAVGDRYQSVLNEFGEITKLLSDFIENENMIEFFKTSSPEETINYIKGIDSYSELLDLKSGCWEGFTVGEHTETVLKVFDDNFSDKVPPELIPFIKFVILNHDIGKGVIYNKTGNKEYENIKELNRLYNKLNISEKNRRILTFIMMESQRYTTNYYVKGDSKGLEMLYKSCQNQLSEYIGSMPTYNEVRGLMSICTILQTCDSAAYTRYGVTRDEKRGIYYKNGNDTFTDSFEEPKDIARRKVKFKIR